jgi:hypothetical protein
VLMEAEAPWQRVVWQRAPVAATPTKKCLHPLCSWQQCELKLFALFWAENPTFLAVYEERDPDRRDALMNRTGISLHTNHITITQYCDQKTRAYQFDDDPSAAHQDWMIPGRRVNGQLFPWFKPTFEVVYEHKGCLQAGYSIPIVVGGTAIIRDIYYRRCDGHYRNICGQALKGGAGEQVIAKGPRDSIPHHLARGFRPFFYSNFHTWAQAIARKQEGLVHGPAVQIRPLGSEATKGKERASKPVPEELVTEGIGLSGRETMCKAEEGGEIGEDDEEEIVGR